MLGPLPTVSEIKAVTVYIPIVGHIAQYSINEELKTKIWDIQTKTKGRSADEKIEEIQKFNQKRIELLTSGEIRDLTFLAFAVGAIFFGLVSVSVGIGIASFAAISWAFARDSKNQITSLKKADLLGT